MRLYAWEAPDGNVGDDLNRWMWPRLLGDVFNEDPETVFIGIGSVLDDRHSVASRRIVFGAGARGVGSAPDITAPGWDMRFVRGPRTAMALGLGPEGWISDPAILAPLAHRFTRPSKPRFALGFAPYFRTRLTYAAALADRTGMRLILPTLDPETFIARLLDCERVVVEAMHGAILADAFGVPWRPVRISGKSLEGPTHEFKWGDWLDSLSLTPSFVNLPYSTGKPSGGDIDQLKLFLSARRAASVLRDALRKDGWTLSDRALLSARQDRMMAQIGALRGELAGSV